MEKVNDEEGIIGSGDQQQQNDFGNPDVENAGELFQKDREILLELLPARVS